VNIFALRNTAAVGAMILTGALFFPQEAATPAVQRKSMPHVSIGKAAPLPDDVSSIDGMIKAYYEVVSGPAGQPRQWARDATLYIPNVRFVVLSEDASGKTSAESMSHQEFVDSSEAALAGKSFYEHEIHRITHRAGNIAHVLSTSERSSSPDGKAEGLGVDSIQLYWDGRRWWITGADLWALNTNKHPLPPEFLP
jgi:hypothetical protein